LLGRLPRARAAGALPFFEARARERQAHGKTAPGKHSAPIGAQRSEVAHRAVDDAAIAFDTSPRNVQRGWQILPCLA
jgi:hypothetical protein